MSSTGKKREFPLDYCFQGDCHQLDVFKRIALPSVDDIFQGFNGTIFAYGQTGSGKSWSMMGGDKRDIDLKGIIPRSADAIFERAGKDQSGTVYTVSCSYLQVYKEKIGDLLDTSKNNLQVREDPHAGVYVDGLTQNYVSSMDEVMSVLLKGDSARAVAATNMNAVSSRSHSVFIMEVSQKTPEGGTRSGRLNLVDLAGSEKVGKTGAAGNTLEEAKKINQSLSALGNVIKSLADGRAHVPYRDSKLTRVLQEALGGNSKTSLLVACSPHLDNIEETVSTLRFAQRAKTIKNRVTVNEEKSVAELMAIINALKKENEGIKAYVYSLEEALREAGIDPDTVAPAQLPSMDGGGGGDGGGSNVGSSDGVSSLKGAEMQAQIDKLNELCRIARADAEQAQAELADKEASIEAAYSEGREAVAAKDLLQKQREGERAIVKKAMMELKSLQIQVQQKDAVIQKAVVKMKELNGVVSVAKQAQVSAEEQRGQLADERAQMESKLKSLSAKVEAMQQLSSPRPAAESSAAVPPPQATRQMELTVPAGAQAGTQFTVELPSGEVVAAVVPQGSVAGQMVQVMAAPVQNSMAPPPPIGEVDDGANVALWRRLDEQQLELDKAQEEAQLMKKNQRRFEAEAENALGELAESRNQMEEMAMKTAQAEQLYQSKLEERQENVSRLEEQMKRMAADGAVSI